MLTYILLKTHSILLSATSRKGHPEADLHAVQDPVHALVSNKQEGLADANSQPVHNLLSAISRKGQQDADLQSV